MQTTAISVFALGFGCMAMARRCWKPWSTAITHSSIRRWDSKHLRPCPAVPGGKDNPGCAWDNAGSYGRGGILPMAVFLTGNSPGLRQPCEARATGWSGRCSANLSRRRPRWCQNCPATRLRAICRSAICSSSIARIRPAPPATPSSTHLELAFEGYGPIGEVRTKDLAGRLIDAMASFPGGAKAKDSRESESSSVTIARPNTPKISAGKCWPTRLIAPCNSPTSLSSKRCNPSGRPRTTAFPR